MRRAIVEASDNERERCVGPPWFVGVGWHLQNAPIETAYNKREKCSFGGMPSTEGRFRLPFDATEHLRTHSNDLIHDRSGNLQAIYQHGRMRSGYFCGKPSSEASEFETLANAAVNALTGSFDYKSHFLGSELAEVFPRIAGGIRYVFGDLPEDIPDVFVAEGWNPIVLQYMNGVLIDQPLSVDPFDSKIWLLLLHRLGWKKIRGSGLRAARFAWSENVEVEWETLTRDFSHLPPEFAQQWDGVSMNTFYSVLGTKENPIDANLASVFAIQLLLSDMTATHIPTDDKPNKSNVNYSQEAWFKRHLPDIKSISMEECRSTITPKIGLMVATEVERQAVLKRMRPPQGKKGVFQVFNGNNTYYLGRFGGSSVVLCMTGMGSTGREASTMVASEFIDEWQLRAVVMVGIAFGKDAEKQAIGNVLISDRVIQYESQRVSAENNVDRGCEPLAGTTLLNRSRNLIGWRFTRPSGDDCCFQVGPILSGEKLVDDPEFKKQLFERYPTAIGGEMEGAGLASAADRKPKKCEWIVVKAICDWADGTKSKEHQAFAAASSVSLVEHVFNQVGAFDAIISD